MSRILLLLLWGTLAAGCSKPASQPTDTGIDATTDAATPAPDASVGGDGTDDTALPGANLIDGCNRLAQEYDCMLPFPSDEFRGADGTVALSDAAAPHDKSRAPVDVLSDHPADGFAVYPSILFVFDDGLDPDSLLAPRDAAVSISPESPTLLIEADTGVAVPHFSEVYLGGGPELQIGAVRPLGRLREGTRYIVAVQGAKTHGGAPVTAPAVFAAMRDGRTVDPAIAELAARFETEIFAPLDSFGVERQRLDLAWDFTTRSRADLTGDMLSVRQGTLDWLASNDPGVTITRVAEGDELPADLVDHTFRLVEGTFTAPLWTDTNMPGATLRGPRGDREIVGTIEVPFSVTIPNSVEADAAQRPARFVQFGHGFFGRRDEVESAVQSQFGDELGVVMGAVDWYGMMRDDRDWVVSRLATGPQGAFGFVPRVHQGMANQLVFSHVIQNGLAADPSVALDAAPAYDPAELYFVGLSQGHILGGTFFALSPAIDRAMLNVGGASFSFILTRSYAFLLFERLLAAWLDPLELLKFEALAPQVLEIVDPVAYAPFVLTDPLPGNPPKQILLQGGLGDTAVPTISLELHARALGIPLLTPSVRDVPFLAEATAPAPSGLTLFDFGVDGELARSWKPVNEDTITHEQVRRFGPAREQVDRFFTPDGRVEDTCNGPCVAP